MYYVVKTTASHHNESLKYHQRKPSGHGVSARGLMLGDGESV